MKTPAPFGRARVLNVKPAHGSKREMWSCAEKTSQQQAASSRANLLHTLQHHFQAILTRHTAKLVHSFRKDVSYESLKHSMNGASLLDNLGLHLLATNALELTAKRHQDVLEQLVHPVRPLLI